MLKNMGNAGRIYRYGLKGNAECVFSIFIADMNMTRSGFYMLELIKKRADPFKGCDPLYQMILNTIALTKVQMIGIFKFAHNHNPINTRSSQFVSSPQRTQRKNFFIKKLCALCVSAVNP
jgi:hypothetical protein